jgi:hypothetical protein
MNSQKQNIVKEYTKIPKLFYSTETEKPFSNCISCDNNLLQPQSRYVIEKAIKQYPEYNTTDVIFEYAMCLNCYQKINEAFSSASKASIEQYFTENVDLNSRRENLLKNKQLSIGEWTSSCIIKGTPIEELTEYQIACQCDGEYMLFTDLPFVIGNIAMDEMMQLLSNKTIGEINGFYDKFFSPDPDIKKLFDEPKFILI